MILRNHSSELMTKMKSTNKRNGFNHNLDHENFQKFPNLVLHLL